MRIVDEALLAEFRQAPRCNWCGRRRACDAHHVHSKGAGRLDVRINLCSLCRECHNLVHDGHITRYDLLAVVAARENTTQDAIEQEVWRLRRAPKGQGEQRCKPKKRRRREQTVRRAWPKRRLRWWTR